VRAQSLLVPETNLFYNAEVAAHRYPDKPFLLFYESPITFSRFRDETERLAGFLQQRCGVRRGDRVLLLMQNSPQFVIAYYAVLRANAIVVPINPMNLTPEILRHVRDAGSRTVVVAQELYSRVEPILGTDGLDTAIVASYSDYVERPTDLALPDAVAAPRMKLTKAGVTLWSDAMAQGLAPGGLTMGADDLCVMPYTSGSTGVPKGCMHTHRSTMFTAVAVMRWHQTLPEMTLLGVAPFFHVTGMQGGMNGPLYNGSTVVILTRWDRDVAAKCVERYGVATWSAVPTLVQDFFLNPNLGNYNLASIRKLSGGGAPMPAAMAERLEARGIRYIEGYGLTETMAPTHINPSDRIKKGCLGVPIFDVESRVIDPETLRELPVGETGEIVMRGPQIFAGYWNKPEETARAFVELDGKSFFRSGDLGRVDADGYFFIVDRLKRMINASGFKVWPSEVEAQIYQHPAVVEVCVIAMRDAYRGESVKAVIVLRPEWEGRLEAQELIEWCRQNMAAYKVPRAVEFVAALPKSGSGKIMWRELQEREMGAVAESSANQASESQASESQASESPGLVSQGPGSQGLASEGPASQGVTSQGSANQGVTSRGVMGQRSPGDTSGGQPVGGEP
jgi:fatty-acyl-CoA synthase